MNKQKFEDFVMPKVYEIEEYIKKNMPDKGDKCEDSQKLCLLDALSSFEKNINGTRDIDFEEDDEDAE